LKAAPKKRKEDSVKNVEEKPPQYCSGCGCASSVTLKMEEARSSKTLVSYHIITWHHIILLHSIVVILQN
jgi:hypothetical protein